MYTPSSFLGYQPLQVVEKRKPNPEDTKNPRTKKPLQVGAIWIDNSESPGVYILQEIKESIAKWIKWEEPTRG